MASQQESKQSFLLNGLSMLLTAWLSAVFVLQLPFHGEAAALDDLAAIANRSLTTFSISFGIAFCLVLLLFHFFKIKVLYGLLGVALLYSVLIVSQAELALLVGVVALWLVILFYLWPQKRVRVNEPAQGEPLPVRYTLMLVAVALLHIIIMSAIMVSRVKAFHAPTYDDGIFAQMFYQMRSNGTQVTTLERSYPLSHFAVHFSPIYYVLLPFYCLLPRAEMLQVLQILVVASGIFPLYLIMKKRGFSATLRLCVGVLYFFIPALSGSSFYGFHENSFLVPLLLWLFYALERQHVLGTIVASILLLSVKEDVIIYFAFIGLWLLFNKRWKAGISLIGIPSLVFLIVISWMMHFGDGTLATSRFPNVSAFPELGLMGIIPTFLLAPAYFLTQVFTPEKWLYLVQMLLPFAFTPLLQRRDPRRLLLLMPFIIMNLISSYPYLHMIGFQYNYGSAVILLYLFILALSDLSDTGACLFNRRMAVTVAKKKAPGLQLSALILGIGIVSAMLITSVLWIDRFDSYRYVQNHSETLQEIERIFAEIPQEASVRASTFYTTPLANRQTIYDLGYSDVEGADLELTDYYVYDLRYALEDGAEYEKDRLLPSGWVVDKYIEGWLLIIRKADMP